MALRPTSSPNCVAPETGLDAPLHARGASAHPALRTHELKGDLKDCWACSAGYDCRLVFEIVKNPKTQESEILLHTAGTHDEVY